MQKDFARITVQWPRVYEWDGARDWVDILRIGFQNRVNIEIVDDIPQPYKGTVLFRLLIHDKVRLIAIGYSDYIPIDLDCAQQVDLYFKMQYDKSGYGLKNVVPGGYVPDGKRLYYYLNRLRFRRDKRQFEYDVFGRFGLDYSREIRERAVSLLNSQGQFRFEGGMKMVAYKDFLSDIARSKVCIDLPGLGDFCFRLVNYLAVGSCVVAYPHRTQFQIPLVDKTHIVYCKDDFSDLVELCDFYVQNSDERERIASNSRDFFEMYLHKDNLVNYYLHTCLTRLT